MAESLASWCKTLGLGPAPILQSFIQQMEGNTGVNPILIPKDVQLHRIEEGRFVVPNDAGDWYATQCLNNRRILELIATGTISSHIVDIQYDSEFLCIWIDPWSGFTPQTIPLEFLVTVPITREQIKGNPQAKEQILSTIRRLKGSRKGGRPKKDDKYHKMEEAVKKGGQWTQPIAKCYGFKNIRSAQAALSRHKKTSKS